MSDASGLGERIKRLRESKKETQEQFAERFGVRQSTIARWESDKQFPDGFNLIRLAVLAGLSVSEFAFGNNVEPMFSIDIIGTAGGPWRTSYLETKGSFTVPSELQGAIAKEGGFALAVEGDDMDSVFPDGSVVMCNPVKGRPEDIDPGARVAVVQRKADGMQRLVLRQLRRDQEDGTAWLWTEPSDSARQVARQFGAATGEIADETIIGVVVGAYRSF